MISAARCTGLLPRVSSAPCRQVQTISIGGVYPPARYSSVPSFDTDTLARYVAGEGGSVLGARHCDERSGELRRCRIEALCHHPVLRDPQQVSLAVSLAWVVLDVGRCFDDSPRVAGSIERRDVDTGPASLAVEEESATVGQELGPSMADFPVRQRGERRRRSAGGADLVKRTDGGGTEHNRSVDTPRATSRIRRAAKDGGRRTDTSMRCRLPFAKKPMAPLSGDQNGSLAPSVSWSSRAVKESNARIHSRGVPFVTATNATLRPSGEISLPPLIVEY